MKCANSKLAVGIALDTTVTPAAHASAAIAPTGKFGTLSTGPCEMAVPQTKALWRESL